MSYRGIVVPLPLGEEGFTGTKNVSVARPTQLLIANNITFEQGTLQKEPGASKYNSTTIGGSLSIIGGWDWWSDTVTQRMVVMTSAGTLLKDSGSGTFPTTLKSGLTVTNVVPQFVEFGKEVAANNFKLAVFTGKNPVQVLSGDGVTTSDLATPPTDWATTNQPVGGFVYINKLWGYGNPNDPHRLYYSTSTNMEDFTGAGSGTLAVFPGEGREIVWAVPFKGLIIIAKYPVGIYVADVRDPAVANWTVQRISNTVGGVGPRAFAILENDLSFIDSAGNTQLLSAVQEFGDVAPRPFSDNFELRPFIDDQLNLSRFREARMIYFAAKRELHIGLSSAGATVNDRRLVYDFKRQQGPPRVRLADRDVCQDIWLRRDANNIQRPVHGDDAGFVWLMDQTDRSKDSNGYLGEARLADNDLSYLDPKLAAINKHFDFLEVIAESKGNHNINADFIIDGVLRETVTFNMGASGGSIGTFVLGTDTLASDQLLSRKQRLHGSGRRFGVRFWNDQPSQDFSIGKVLLHCRVGEEALRNA